jgi:hypothetical protein
VRASVNQARDLLCGDDAAGQVRALIEKRLDALRRVGQQDECVDEGDLQAPVDALISRIRALFAGEAQGELAERQRLGEAIALLLDALPQLIRARGGLEVLQEALATGEVPPRERESALGQDAPPTLETEDLIDKVLGGIVGALLHRAIVVLDELLHPPEGYFRDGYNDTCVLWTTGLFWMTDVAQITGDTGDDGWPEWWRHRQAPQALSVSQVRQLHQHIQRADQRMPTRERLARWNHLRVDGEGEHSLAAWHAHLRERRDQLLAFLDEALRREESILCSL